MFHESQFHYETVPRGTIKNPSIIMKRKKREAKTEITPALIKFREKRKWQIALRRYILEKNPCSFYAPYFGIDIESFRKWIELQFDKDLGWNNFSKQWQFDHIIPVIYFDFQCEEDLRMCWNFINIRVEKFALNKNRGNRLDVLAAKDFFSELYKKTSYSPSLKLVEKIDRIELSEIASTEKQQDFIMENRDYLDMISKYSPLNLIFLIVDVIVVLY